MAMEGRWTIWTGPSGSQISGDRDTLWKCATPVVPCDDAAVERVAEYLWVREMRHSDHPNSTAAARRWWAAASEPVRASWLQHAEAVLRVAGMPLASEPTRDEERAG